MKCLIGLIAPYETPTRINHPRLGQVTVLIRRGAFAPIVGKGPPVLIAHDRRRRIAEAFLFTNNAGLYGIIDLPTRSQQLEVVRYARHCGVRGVRVRASVHIGESESYWSAPPARIETITRVASLVEVSLIGTPAYKSTWLALDSDDARRRIAREDVDARERELLEMKAS